MNAPLILSLAVMLYAVLHSWLASLGAKAWVRQRLGPSAERWYRLAYNLFAGGSGLPSLPDTFSLGFADLRGSTGRDYHHRRGHLANGALAFCGTAPSCRSPGGGRFPISHDRLVSPDAPSALYRWTFVDLAGAPDDGEFADRFYVVDGLSGGGGQIGGTPLIADLW